MAPPRGSFYYTLACAASRGLAWHICILSSDFLLLHTPGFFNLKSAISSILHNRRKRLRIQTRPTDQRAINFFF